SQSYQGKRNIKGIAQEKDMDSIKRRKVAVLSAAEEGYQTQQLLVIRARLLALLVFTDIRRFMFETAKHWSDETREQYRCREPSKGHLLELLRELTREDEAMTNRPGNASRDTPRPIISQMLNFLAEEVREVGENRNASNGVKRLVSEQDGIDHVRAAALREKDKEATTCYPPSSSSSSAATTASTAASSNSGGSTSAGSGSASVASSHPSARADTITYDDYMEKTLEYTTRQLGVAFRKFASTPMR
ncbi:unnamed protein product, partial [Amoebophrya sp. A120]